MARRNTESCRWCPWVAAAAVSLVGWFGFVRGDARPDLLRQRTEAVANHDLAGAGYPWARLRIDGDSARLIGKAPSNEARASALAIAPQLLARFMGMPGVFEQLVPEIEVASAAEQRALREARMALLRSGAEIDLPPTSAGWVVGASASAAGGSPAEAASPAAGTGAAPPAAPGAAQARIATAAPLPPVPDAAAQVRPDPACQRELITLQRKHVLRFMPAAATLDVGQEDTLDALAALLRRCPTGRVLVHGLREPLHAPAAAASAHADDTVPGGGSLLLAQRRAQAVLAELVARGVARQRLQLGAGAREVPGDAPARVDLTLAPLERA
ncbi:MAG: hypothetical protein RLZZ584_1980 [Pseudomonadota bacterium]